METINRPISKLKELKAKIKSTVSVPLYKALKEFEKANPEGRPECIQMPVSVRADILQYLRQCNLPGVYGRMGKSGFMAFQAQVDYKSWERNRRYSLFRATSDNMMLVNVCWKDDFIRLYMFSDMESPESGFKFLTTPPG